MYIRSGDLQLLTQKMLDSFAILEGGRYSVLDKDELSETGNTSVTVGDAIQKCKDDGLDVKYAQVEMFSHGENGLFLGSVRQGYKFRFIAIFESEKLNSKMRVVKGGAICRHRTPLLQYFNVSSRLVGY